MAAAESDLVGPLLKACSGPAPDKKAELVGFLGKVLQPELLMDPPWKDSFANGPLIIDAARGAAANVRNSLGRHGQALWSMLATVLATGSVPRSFLKDCAEVAYRSPVS